MTILFFGTFLSRSSTVGVAAPILLEEAKVAGVEIPQAKSDVPTPACDRMRAAGLWNKAWDSFFELDPLWTEQFMAAGVGVYHGGMVTPRFTELLRIAFDASYTHMYPPGTRRHIRAALQAGATPAEIMEVLKICVSQGVQASNRGVPMLDEELARKGKGVTMLDDLEAEPREIASRERHRRDSRRPTYCALYATDHSAFTFYFRTGRVAHPLVARSE